MPSILNYSAKIAIPCSGYYYYEPLSLTLQCTLYTVQCTVYNVHYIGMENGYSHWGISASTLWEVHRNMYNWWELYHCYHCTHWLSQFFYLLAYIWSKPVQQTTFRKILLPWAGFFLPEKRVSSSSLDIISKIFNFRSLVYSLASLLIYLSDI